jgi:membrane-bound metal-dependent hydrolase YbcI (DUF457 family)
MLYPTHQQFGKLFTVAAVPIAIKLEILPKAPDIGMITINPMVYLVNCLPLIVAAAIAYMAGVWGSGYPDIDSPSSVPHRTNPLLAFLFRTFGVKHRGRFSHSLASITLTFGAAYAFVKFVFPQYLGSVIDDNMVDPRLTDYLIMFKYACGMVGIWVIFAYVGAVSHWIGDMLTTDGAYIFWEKKIKMFDSPAFRAGSAWEKKVWEPLTKYSYIPALIFVGLLIFGQINLYEVVKGLVQ